MSATPPRSTVATLPGGHDGDTLRPFMAEPTEPLLQDCTKCGTLIDVTDEEPFARMHCPSCGESLRVRRQFDHFEIQEALGSGGMGTVYRALDHNLHRAVALKLLRKDLSNDPEFIKQFEHEAAITAQITHPNVVKVYSTGSDRGLFFIAMELVDKGSLDDVMTKEGAVPELKALEVGIQIAAGLNAALKCGLIHRDVKPGNILFADAKNSKIVDFGLAVRMDEAGTVGGEIWGTPYYVAPEKLANQPEDFRSDIYSLAASLFHAIAAKPPCETEDATINTLLTLKRSLKPLEQVAPGVSSETAYVINRALKADPAERYQTYEDFIKHLEYARAEGLKREAAKAIAARQAPPAKMETRHAVSWVTLGMLTAVALGGAAVYTYRDLLFGPDASLQSAQPALPLEATPQERYEQAQMLLAEGKLEDAAAAFRQVESHSATTRPLSDWAALHAGLSSLLADQEDAAQLDFQRLSSREAFSHEPGRAELAEFFITTGAHLATHSMESASPETRSGPHLALLPLLWGAKAWSEGHLARAGTLFRQFAVVEIAPSHAWIAGYRPLAERFAKDAEAYEAIAGLWKAAGTEDARALALPQLQNAAAEAKLTGKAGALLQALVQEAEQSVAAARAERERSIAESEAADAQALAEVRPKTELLFTQFRFADARGALMMLQPRSEKGQQRKALLVKRADWLAKFKLSLIQDLIAHRFPAPIGKRSGEKLDGVVENASDSGLAMKLQFGTAAVPWSDIALESVYTMARSFLRLDPLPDRAADRRWHLGIFALMAGKHEEGKAWLQQAAQLKPTYQPQIPEALASFGLSESSPSGANAPAGMTEI